MPVYRSKLALAPETRRKVCRSAAAFFEHVEGLDINLTAIVMVAGHLRFTTTEPIPVEQLDHLGIEEMP